MLVPVLCNRSPVDPALTGFNELAGYPGKIRPGRRGGPAVDLFGTVTTGVGRLGPCAVFDGASCCGIGLGAGYDVFRTAGDWTLAVDFYPTAHAAPGVNMSLLNVACPHLGNNQLKLFIYKSGGGDIYLFFQAWKSASSGGPFSYYVQPVGSLNTWSTAVLRFKSSDASYTLDCSGQRSTAPNDGTAGAIWCPTEGRNNLQLGGRFDANGYGVNNGFGEFFTGRMGPVRAYTRRLSDAEVTAISAGSNPFGADTAPRLIFSDPFATKVHQRNGSSQATVAISGAIAVPDPIQTLTDLEYSWNGTAFADLGATVDNVNHTFSGSATIAQTSATPAGRQGDLIVRLKNNTSVSVTIPKIGIGDVIPEWGQSNRCGAYTNPQPYAPANGLTASVFDHSYVIRELRESDALYNLHAAGESAWVDGSSESRSKGSTAPREMAIRVDRTGYPVMVVPCACSGTGIGVTDGSQVPGWNSLGSAPGRFRVFTLRDSLIRRISMLTAPPGGGPKALFAEGWQGEQDAAASMTAAAYRDYFAAFADAIYTALGIKSSNVLLQNCSGIPDGQEQNIRDGVALAAALTANALVGADLSGYTTDDAFHFNTDAKAILIAADEEARAVALGY